MLIVCSGQRITLQYEVESEWICEVANRADMSLTSYVVHFGYMLVQLPQVIFEKIASVSSSVSGRKRKFIPIDAIASNGQKA